MVVGNDPTCGPNMAHDWTDAGHQALRRPGRRARGPRPRNARAGPGGAGQAGHGGQSAHDDGAGLQLPYTINWSQAHVPAILHMTHALAGRGHGDRRKCCSAITTRRAHGRDMAGIDGSAAADDGLRHSPRPHLHVFQRGAAVSRSATASATRRSSSLGCERARRRFPGPANWR